jgi:major membrane immunogen (membrane-anchored lipoprotein)
VIEINVTRHNIFDHHHGMYQLHLQNSDGKGWFTGISVHLLGSGYDPTVYDTRDSDSTTTIQEAIDKWEAAVIAKITGGTPDATTLPGAIVLVYPNDVDVDNPTGAHVENVIMTYPGAKIQGIGTFLRFDLVPVNCECL